MLCVYVSQEHKGEIDCDLTDEGVEKWRSDSVEDRLHYALVKVSKKSYKVFFSVSLLEMFGY